MQRRQIITLVLLVASVRWALPGFGEDFNLLGYARLVSIPPQAAGVSAYPPGIFVVGDTVYVASGPARLWFDLEVGGWAPNVVDTLQVHVDPAGLSSGSGDALGVPVVPCTGDVECASAMGPGAQCLASNCEVFYLDDVRSNLPTELIVAANQHNLTAGFTKLPFSGSGVSDEGVPIIMHTLVIDVPAGASGVYSIGLEQTADRGTRSFLVSNGFDYLFANLEATRVVVGGACCSLYECVEDPIGWPECVMAGGGMPVPACLGDCNGNEIDDACEAGPDCDGNGVLDECDIAAGAPDCNWNGVPDACDITRGTVPDCDGNHVPDLCDVGRGAPDCNHNAVPDYCELATGDCDGDGALDVCVDPGASDCNNNAASDACELTRYPGLDCNGNGAIDSCDVASGSSPDANGDCIPDECGDTIGALAVDFAVRTSRFISFVPAGAGCLTTMQVRFTGLTPHGVGSKFSPFVGKNQYLGKPRLVWEDQSHTSLVLAAPLQCTPYVFELPATGPLHVYGAGIMPESTYEVRRFDLACGNLNSGLCFTSPLTVRTSVWGDCLPPFADDPGADPQPNFVDIAGVVDKFMGSDDPPRIAAELEPSVLDLSVDLDFRDIAACVRSFQGQAYPLDGPTACP